ncbi:MAG: metallophosphoesterase [Eubacteriales bacterium]|nr:metallophosphoesterase [Eubacteriales bacterium]
MFAENVKLQTHVHHIRTNLHDGRIRRRLALNGLALVLYSLSVVYVSSRVWLSVQSVMPVTLFILMVGALAGFLPAFAYAVDQGRVSRPLIRTTAYVGFYWLAFYIYLLIPVTVIDLVYLLGRLIRGTEPHGLPAVMPINRVMLFGLSVPFSLMVLLIGTYLARSPRVRTFRIKLDKPFNAGQPLRIAFLSDLHVGSLVSVTNLKRMTERVNALRPDLILLGGDLIDNSLHLMEKSDFTYQMSQLKGPYGRYAVLGNHELVNTSAEEMAVFLDRAGIGLLQDDVIEVAGLVLAGRNEHQTEYSGSMDRLTPEALLENTDPDRPLIVMQHQPADLDFLAGLGADLALAGHTHRGQLFPLNLLQKHQYCQTRRYARINQLHSVISAGYGTWGPPVRIGSRSEITLIQLSGRSF